jgi:hypothetical protein
MQKKPEKTTEEIIGFVKTEQATKWPNYMPDT